MTQTTQHLLKVDRGLLRYVARPDGRIDIYQIDTPEAPAFLTVERDSAAVPDDVREALRRLW